MDINDRIKAFDKEKDCNWQRLIFLLRKHLDIWGHKNIKPFWGQMKISYMPVIFNIKVDGSTVMDIARESMIVKQTVSRTVKELEEKGMITSKINKDDKRSELLELTPKGKQMVLDSRQQANHLHETYKKLVGAKDLKIAEDVIKKIIEYHESLNTHNEEDFGD